MSDSTAERILELAAERFDAAEVLEESEENVSVEFEDNRLKEIRTRQRRGIGLRVIDEGRIGFASTTDLRRPERLVQMAAASAAFGDEARFEFPGQPCGAAEVQTHAPSMADVSAEQMVDMGCVGMERAQQEHEDYLFSAGISRTLHTQRVLNTSGLDLAYDSTGMSGSVEVKVFGEDGLLDVYEYRSWGEPFDSILDLTETVLSKMERASTVVAAKPQQMPMIFVPKGLRNLFMPIGVALNGKNVHKGASVLRGRIGEQIIDERLTIWDDPTVDFAPGSCPADDEGTPTRRQPLFENGVLKTYLADRQTAGLLGIEPTGHGFRSYASRPSPSDTNTVVEAGDTPLGEMIAGLERGFIIDQTLGSGQSNLLAGEFSVNVALGFFVENGKVTGRVKDCMVAGNVYEVLRKVQAIGKERQWLGSSYAPALMVGGLKLATQG